MTTYADPYMDQRRDVPASTSKAAAKSSLSYEAPPGRPAWASPSARLDPLSTSSRGSKAAAPRGTSGREAANAAMRRARQHEPHGHNPGVRTLVRNSRLPSDAYGCSGRGAQQQMTTYVSLEQLKGRAPSGRVRNTNLHSLNSLAQQKPQQPHQHHLLPLHNAPAGKQPPARTHPRATRNRRILTRWLAQVVNHTVTWALRCARLVRGR